MVYKYDLFISYATENRKIADYLVERIERRGYRCFIAPRDIKTGAEYAVEIVGGISNSVAVLLIFSSESDKSHYVLREINSAVSRNKPIIPIRVEDFLPSEAMEFYLGPTHWLDAFPEILDVHLDKVITLLSGMANKHQQEKESGYTFPEPQMLKVSELQKLGISYKDMTMKEIEIDYLCIPSERFDMNDQTEGTFDDWANSAREYENETSALLIYQDDIIGYCDVYPVTPQAYQELINGKVIIRDSMIELFCMGGEFNIYNSMIGIVPEYATQSNYLLVFDWIFQHLEQWKKEGILACNIGISVYSDILEKFVKMFGFEFKCYNPAKGKVYETDFYRLVHNPNVCRRYAKLGL